MADLNGITSTDGRPWANLSPSIVPLPARPKQLTMADIVTNADVYMPPPPPPPTPPIANAGETCLAMAQRLARIRGLPALDGATWRQKLHWSAVPPHAMALDWEAGVLRVLSSCTPGGLLTRMP